MPLIISEVFWQFVGKLRDLKLVANKHKSSLEGIYILRGWQIHCLCVSILAPQACFFFLSLFWYANTAWGGLGPQSAAASSQRLSSPCFGLCLHLFSLPPHPTPPDFQFLRVLPMSRSPHPAPVVPILSLTSFRAHRHQPLRSPLPPGCCRSRVICQTPPLAESSLF